MQTRAQIKFVDKDRRQFFVTLKSRVDEYFEQNGLSKHANATMVIKTIVLLFFYLGPFVYLLLAQPSVGFSMLLWTIMGLAMAGVGMSVMHDAVHGAYSANPVVNNIMSYVLYLLGGSIFNWKLQHNVLHHTYTNVINMDDDINDKLILRFSPHSEAKPYHRFQWMYAFAFYCITTLYWVTAKDFVQFFKYTAEGVNRNTKAQNAWLFVRITFLKVVYMAIVLVLPTWGFGIPFGQVIGGFLLMHAVSGLVLTTVFQLAHSLEETAHPIPNEQGLIENEWAIHQLNTTANFSRHNKWLSWYVGGLNFQVEHHLFPKICHVHYPVIAPIVEQTAREFGIPYLENDTFFTALRSHVAILKQLGKLPDLNEALG